MIINYLIVFVGVGALEIWNTVEVTESDIGKDGMSVRVIKLESLKEE